MALASLKAVWGLDTKQIDASRFTRGCLRARYKANWRLSFHSRLFGSHNLKSQIFRSARSCFMVFIINKWRPFLRSRMIEAKMSNFIHNIQFSKLSALQIIINVL